MIRRLVPLALFTALTLLGVCVGCGLSLGYSLVECVSGLMAVCEAALSYLMVFLVVTGLLSIGCFLFVYVPTEAAVQSGRYGVRSVPRRKLATELLPSAPLLARGDEPSPSRLPTAERGAET